MNVSSPLGREELAPTLSPETMLEMRGLLKMAKRAGYARVVTAALGLAALVPPLGCSKTQPAKPPAAEPTARVVYVVVTPTQAPDRMDPVLAAALTAVPQPSPSPTTAEPLPRFAGKGHEASNLFSLSAGLYVFRLEHTGDRNFIVHLVDERGRSIESLVNEIGQFSGSKAVQIQRAGKYLLNIVADGDWSISVSSPGSPPPSAPLAERAAVPTEPPRRPTAYSVPVAAAKPTPEQPYCVIQDFVTRQPDSLGNVWFDGDVVNLGSSPAKVVILVKAYSINFNLLDSKTTYPNPNPIPSGQKAHFHSYVTAGFEERRPGWPSIIRKVFPEVLPQ